MKLLVQSAMIFFGTLMAAGLVALGDPAGWPGGSGAGGLVHPMPSLHALNGWVEPALGPAADALTGWHE